MLPSQFLVFVFVYIFSFPFLIDGVHRPGDVLQFEVHFFSEFHPLQSPKPTWKYTGFKDKDRRSKYREIWPTSVHYEPWIDDLVGTRTKDGRITDPINDHINCVIENKKDAPLQQSPGQFYRLANRDRGNKTQWRG
jgi:hypothetical protein